MKVKELIEDLKQAPEDSEVCFIGNGTWPIAGIEIGIRPGSPVGYVVLRSSKEAYKRLPIRKVE
jgi:hypothetical protein